MKILLREYLIRYWEKEDASAIAKYANNRNMGDVGEKLKRLCD